MLKRFAAAALLLTVAVTGAACSSKDDKNSSASPAASQSAAASPAATASANPDAYKLSAYTAVRLGEEKLDILFHNKKVEDKPVMNSVIAADKDKAAKFLNAYFDPALTEKILSFYLTADKASDGSVIVKADKFYPVSVIKTVTKDDVTYEGDASQVKLTTKDNTVFTVKKNDQGKYVVADIAKK